MRSLDPDKRSEQASYPKESFGPDDPCVIPNHPPAGGLGSGSLWNIVIQIKINYKVMFQKGLVQVRNKNCAEIREEKLKLVVGN
jgi:hypothetical protein